MLKKLLVIAVLAVSVGIVRAPAANAAVAQPTYFCHRSNSVKNPYQVKPFSTTFSEIDGQGQNDHSQHTGPIATSPQVAQNLKNNKQDWGDIIPPVAGVLPAGLNWTAEGEAIYNNDCNYATPDFDEALITYEVVCAEVNGKQQVVVTLTNDGQVNGSAFVNGVEVPVAANSNVTQNFDSGTSIEIVIEGQTVYADSLVCEEPETPQVLGTTTTTTPQVVAPVAGVSAGGGSVLTTIAGLTASLGALGYGGFRLRKFNS